MLRRLLLCAAGIGLMVSLAAGGRADQDTGTIKLFNGVDFTGWKMFLPPNAKKTPQEIWSVKDGVIVCEGSVAGYLLTDKEYENYELRLEWRWGEKAGSGRNSGVFVHVSGPDKVWPKGAEAQLMAGNAGDFWLVDGFKLKIDESRRDARTPRHFLRLSGVQEKPIGEWNQYVITCLGDTIRLAINGQLANE